MFIYIYFAGVLHSVLFVSIKGNLFFQRLYFQSHNIQSTIYYYNLKKKNKKNMTLHNYRGKSYS